MILDRNEQRCLYRQIRYFMDNNLKYALYGTGQISHEILSLARERGLDLPEVIIDHVSSLQAFEDIPVVAVSELGSTDIEWVLLGSNTYHAEMRRQILEHGYDSTNIVSFAHMRMHVQRMQERNNEIHWEKYLGIVWNIHRNLGDYAIYTSRGIGEELLRRLRFHGLPLPSAILSHGPWEEEDIPVVLPQDLTLEQARTVIVGDWDFAETMISEVQANESDILVLDLYSEETSCMYALDFSRVTKFPFVSNKAVIMGLSNRCNLCCEYCYSPAERKALNKSPEMSLSEAYSLLEKFRGHASILGLVDYGEPLMYKQLDQVIEKAEELDYPLKNFTTNGVLLTEKRSLALAAAGLNLIHLSIDSLCESYNRKVRGISTEQVIAHGEAFSKLTGLPVVINSVVTQDNLRLFAELPALKRRIPTIDTIHLFLVTPQTSDFCSRGLSSQIDMDILRPEMAKLKENCRQHGIGLLEVCNFTIPNSAYKSEACKRAWNTFYIRTDGTMKTCFTGYYSTADHPDVNVLETDATPLELFNHPALVRVRRQMLCGELPEMCKSCTYAS